jgi:tyrosine-protein kinase Etk/Wzc
VTDRPGNNFWIVLEIIAKHRGLLFGIVFLATIISVVVVFVMPKWYEAQVLILPPKDASSSLDQMSKLSEVVSVTGGLNLPVMVTPSDVYARILKSQRVTDRIIERFNLKQRYNSVTYFDTYSELLLHARFIVTEEGLLSIKVEDKDPQTAADIANAFAEELNAVNQEIVSDRARRNRIFIQGRLNEVKTALDSSRMELESFQLTNKAVDLDAQTRLAINQAADLKVSLARLNLDITMTEQLLGKDNPDLVEKRQRRDLTQQQLDQLETGGKDSSFFSLPVSAIPNLKGRYELLYSRVRVSESLYSMLLGEFEKAKLQEEELSLSISVLDQARVPEVKSRPRRTFIVSVVFGLSIIAGVLFACLIDYLERLKKVRPEDYQRAKYTIDAFLGWIPGVRKH